MEKGEMDRGLMEKGQMERGVMEKGEMERGVMERGESVPTPHRHMATGKNGFQ